MFRRTYRSRRGNAECEGQLKSACGAWCATAQLEDGSYIAVPLLCRSWNCPVCARILKRRLLRRLGYAKPNLFATLTTSPRTAATPAEAFVVANAAIASLIKRWRRKFPNDRVDYFLVWEQTKAGWPHAHLLLRAPPVSKHWLSHTWNELTRSYVTDLQKVNAVSHAATYLAKYLAKDPAVPEGFRRWRRSAGFFCAADEPLAIKLPVLSAWELQPRPAEAQAYFWLETGFAIEFSPDGIIHARDDPEEHFRQMGSLLPTQLRHRLAALLPYMTFKAEGPVGRV